jgi:hypothetical protein
VIGYFVYGLFIAAFIADQINELLSNKSAGLTDNFFKFIKNTVARPFMQKSGLSKTFEVLLLIFGLVIILALQPLF